MRILLIEPPATDKEDITSFRYPPLGLIALAAYTREKNHQVFLVDANAEKKPRQKILEILKKEEPSMVGIGAMSVNIGKALQVAELVKYFFPKTFVVLGGIHPTTKPEEVIKNKFVDFVVRGEGEITLSELVEFIERKRKDFEKINGLCFKINSQPVINPPRELIPDLDSLPIPAYDLLDIKKYRAPYTSKTPFMIMARSRGCPFECTFCGISQMFGQRYRSQSPQRSILEVEYLINNFKVKEMGFKDSEFTLDAKNVESFCDLLIKNKYDLVWNCNGRVNHAGYSLLKKMKQAGCIAITYGIESGDQEVLDNMKKQTTLQQARDAVKISKDVGLKVVGNFMIGNPGDTKQTIEHTINFAKELNLDYAYFGFTTPFPGTELRKQALAKGWMLDERLEAIKYENCIMNATNLPTAKLNKYLNKAYRSFYLRPSYIAKRLLMLNRNEIYNSIRGALSIAKDAIK